MEEHDVKPLAVVYLTDGECDSFPETPNCEVLWMQYGNHDFKPPFGEVTKVK